MTNPESVHSSTTKCCQNPLTTFKSETLKGFKWIWADFRKPHLTWVKAIFMLQTISLVTLYPYLILHLRSLGFTLEDAALVNTAVPLADIVGPPIAGLLADKIGNFRLFMAAITFLNGGASLLLLTVPQVEASENSNNIGSSIFWHYLLVRVLLDIFRASSLMLFEGAVVAIIKEHGGDYGLQRIFGTFGAIVFGPLAGLLIDKQRQEVPGQAYLPVILLYFVMRTVTGLCILKLDLKFKPPATKMFRNIWKVLCQTEVIAFLTTFLISGALWGFLENFLFWVLEDLGATKFLMGASLAIGTLAGVPLTIFSGLIISKAGYRNVALLSLLLYTVRLTAFSRVTSPAWFLVFEFFKPFCTSLLLIAVFSFVKATSPLETAATIESIFGSSYYGVGRGVGGLLGGLAIEHLGRKLSFEVVAMTSGLTALIYLIVTECDEYFKSRRPPRLGDLPEHERLHHEQA